MPQLKYVRLRNPSFSARYLAGMGRGKTPKPQPIRKLVAIPLSHIQHDQHIALAMALTVLRYLLCRDGRECQGRQLHGLVNGAEASHRAATRSTGNSTCHRTNTGPRLQRRTDVIESSLHAAARVLSRTHGSNTCHATRRLPSSTQCTTAWGRACKTSWPGFSMSRWMRHWITLW